MEPHLLSKICFFTGLVAVLISMLIWFQGKAGRPEDKSRLERLALFIGLWAPSLFALAGYFRLGFRV